MRWAFCVVLAAGVGAQQLDPHLQRYEGLETERSKQPFHFKHKETVTVPHDYYGEVQKSTFRSPAIKLSNGEAWFTLPTVNRMPFPTPGKNYAIIRMEPDIVREDGSRPPTSELYGHHWLMYDKVAGGSGDDLGCGGQDTFVSNIFGSGAELRGTFYRYPDGYGYMSNTGEKYFSGNLHFINTLDLSTQHFKDQPNPRGAALKACIECNWSPGNTGIGCKQGAYGDFACCRDLGRCLTNNMLNTTKTVYYLQYDIYWTTDIHQVKPLRYGVVDTWQCASLGTIYQNANVPGHRCNATTCIGQIERTIDISGTIVWMYGHMHVGAIEGKVYHNGKHVCTSKPHYGTDPSNPIGNEQGYIKGIDLCIHADGKGGAKDKTVIKVKKGDRIKVQAIYDVKDHDKRIAPMPGGVHGGVMGLFYFTINPSGSNPPASAGYRCKDGACVESSDGSTIDICKALCGSDTPAPAPAPAPPPPTPAALYGCFSGVCQPDPNGVPQQTCLAVCT